MGCVSSKEEIGEEDLEYLLQNTRYDEHTIRELYKNFKKDCPDGELSKNLFHEMYLASFPGENAKDFVDKCFATFDTDQSGYIDFREFILATDSITNKGGLGAIAE